MSDYLPFDLQLEILKRLPVKFLIQFRSVSKPWKSLIDSSDFIKHYSSQPTNQQHLFLTYYGCLDDRYVSIADDNTFPHQKHHLNFPQWLIDYDLIGCSHGLLCLSYAEDETKIAIIWNFFIRKAVAVVVPNAPKEVIYKTVLGFGVCRETTDPKIVKLTYIRSESATESIISCIHWQVDVFSLSTWTWRSAYGNLPRKSIDFDRDQVVIDGVLYRLAGDRINEDGCCMCYNLIISFDLTSEEFREVNIRDGLNQFGVSLSISKLRDSLVVIEPAVKENNYVIGIWMMEDGVSEVFTKLFTVNVGTWDAKVKGFRKSGEPIIGISKDYSHKVVVYEPYSKHSNNVVYEPYSKHSNNVVIDGIEASYYLIPYMESLLLLNESDLTVHKEMETLKFEDDFLLEPSFSYWFNGKSEDDFLLEPCFSYCDGGQGWL